MGQPSSRLHGQMAYWTGATSATSVEAHSRVTRHLRHFGEIFARTQCLFPSWRWLKRYEKKDLRCTVEPWETTRETRGGLSSTHTDLNIRTGYIYRYTCYIDPARMNLVQPPRQHRKIGVRSLGLSLGVHRYKLGWLR